MKIKVLNIITKLELGGAQKVALYSANGLGENFESYFISGEFGILDNDKIQNYPNIKQFYNITEMKREISPINDLIAFFKLIKLIRKIRAQIVHTHCPKAGVLGRWATFFSGIKNVKIIHTHHGFAYSKNPIMNFYTIIEQINSSITHKLIFVSNENLEFALKNKITKKEKSEKIRCGIDIAKYNGKISNKNTKIIGTIACFKEAKAPLDIIKIANELKNDGFEFVIIGDGELRSQIELEIKKFGLKNIKLLGWRQDIKELLHTFDIFILTSLSEGLPMSILEAMASGLPIIATNVGGIKDLIKNNHNGILLEPHDIFGFVKNIKNLANDENMRNNFVKNSYEILTNEFDKNKTIENIRDLYLRSIQCKKQ